MAKRRKSVWRGALAGVAGGLAGAWAMNQFQAGWSALSARIQQDGDSGSQPTEQEHSEDATMKTAGAISDRVLNRPLSYEEKKKTSPFVHYIFGSSMGALYGAAAEEIPGVKAGFGLPFGAALFVGADEIAVPALGLAAQAPWETSMRDHLYSLLSHCVYGATAEVIRRGVRAYL